MRLPISSWCLLLVLTSLSSPAALASESPFLQFVGRYYATPTHCSINGRPVGGCQLTAVELKQKADGSFVIFEDSPEGSDAYPLYEISEKKDSGSFEATITGSATHATWEALRTGPDGTEWGSVKLFERDGDTLSYHSCDHQRDPSAGVDATRKQTYTLEPKPAGAP